MVRAATLKNRASTKEDEKLLREDSSKQDEASEKLPCKGIVNLGNTCFFNSVMQNLLRTDSLRGRLVDVDEAPNGADAARDDDEGCEPFALLIRFKDFIFSLLHLTLWVKSLSTLRCG